MYRIQKRFIVVEDDSSMRENITYFLHNMGHTVLKSFEKADPEEMKKVINDADIILMDINLPGKINGVQLAHKVREFSDKPIIYVTGNVDNSIFEQASKTNIYGYLPKPFSKSQFEYTINVALLREVHEREKERQFTQIKEKEKLIQIGEFAGGFIHDVNNFNMIIIACLEAIRNISKGRDEIEEFKNVLKYAEKGQIGTKKIDSLAKRYRRFFLKSNKAETSEVSLNIMLKELEDFLKGTLTKLDIALIQSCEDNITLNTCEITLLQALVNLISNSKYEIVEKNLTDRWIRIEVKKEMDNRIIIILSDSGQGIPKEVSANIFNQGFSTKVENELEGSGMGLSFVKKNVEEVLGGTIELIPNTLNTTFKITLPI